MVVNSKNFVLLCITLYSLLLRETLWYSVVKLRLHPSLKKKSFFFFVLHAVPYCTYTKPVIDNSSKKQILGLTVV